MYSCHSVDENPEPHGEGVHHQGALKGSKMPIARAFAQTFGFHGVKGTNGAVNYYNWTKLSFPWSSNYYKPYPQSGRWTFYYKSANR